MHITKVIVLLLCMLAVMRACSWILLWLLGRLAKSTGLRVMLVSNVGALLLYLAVLFVDRVPGEFMDARAALFGFFVYAAFAALDWKWPLR